MSSSSPAVPSQLPVCETLADQQHDGKGWSHGLGQEDPEPTQIKEEQQELGTSQEEEQLQECKDADIIQFILPPSSPWVDHDQDPSPSLQPQSQNRDGVEDGSENGGPLSRLNKPQSNKTQTVKRQRSRVPSRKSTELPHVKPVKSNHCCHLCEKSFSYMQHLLNHVQRVHSKDTEIHCGVCGKSLESNDSLTVHLKTHINTRICHVCGKHCVSNSAMTEHMASHTGVKPHRCHVCGKECSRKGDMKIHMRIHTGEKPFCCPFCSKGFTHSGHLKKHMRSHTGERPYQCEVCGRGFAQSIHLKNHLKTHLKTC